LVVSSAYKNGTNNGMSGSRHRKDGCQNNANLKERKTDQEHLKQKMMAKSDALHKRMMASMDSQLEKMKVMVDVFEERMKMDTMDLEANLKKLEAVTEQQDAPKEEAAVETI
jgi:hypothetical protein